MINTDKGVSIEVQSFALGIEKQLCDLLGRTWSPIGISIQSLLDEIGTKLANRNTLSATSSLKKDLQTNIESLDIEHILNEKANQIAIELNALRYSKIKNYLVLGQVLGLTSWGTWVTSGALPTLEAKSLDELVDQFTYTNRSI